MNELILAILLTLLLGFFPLNAQTIDLETDSSIPQTDVKKASTINEINSNEQVTTEKKNSPTTQVDPIEKNKYSIGTLMSYHMFMSYNDYRPKLTENGRVVISPIFMRMRKKFNEDEVYSFFTGNDSIGYPIIGAVREFNFIEDERASSTGYMGFYFIYDRAWRKEVNHPEYYATIIKKFIAISMPLIGVKNSFVVYKDENYKTSLDLLISIGLINLGIFYSF